MNNVLKTIAALAIVAAGAAAPNVASAQGLDTALNILGAGGSFGSGRCTYVRGTIATLACQAGRVSQTARMVRNRQRLDQVQRSSDERFRSLRLSTALQKACRAGDRRSCDRAGTNGSPGMTVMHALREACLAGDRDSCERTRDDVDATPNIQASHGCAPVMDRKTGFRIVGRFDCR